MVRMEIRKDIRTKNLDNQIIPVEFVVIHYTACTLKKTLEILCDESRKVSAHLVIDSDGTSYELIPCLDEPPLRGWHAGKSVFNDKDGKEWTAFNDFSIGIELVNENGNIYSFTEEQYQSLVRVLQKLKDTHPNLRNPERIVGHEQIAGFRGKSDPGSEFDWSRVLKAVYPSSTIPEHSLRLAPELLSALKNLAKHAPQTPELRDTFFAKLSEILELLPVSDASRLP